CLRGNSRESWRERPGSESLLRLASTLSRKRAVSAPYRLDNRRRRSTSKGRDPSRVVTAFVRAPQRRHSLVPPTRSARRGYERARSLHAPPSESRSLPPAVQKRCRPWVRGSREPASG